MQLGPLVHPFLRGLAPTPGLAVAKLAPSPENVRGSLRGSAHLYPLHSIVTLSRGNEPCIERFAESGASGPPDSSSPSLDSVDWSRFIGVPSDDCTSSNRTG